MVIDEADQRAIEKVPGQNRGEQAAIRPARRSNASVASAQTATTASTPMIGRHERGDALDVCGRRIAALR